MRECEKYVLKSHRCRTEREESLNMAPKIVNSNDHEKVVSPGMFRRETTLVNDKRSENKVLFILLFTSNEVSTAIKCCLKRAGLEKSVAVITKSV